MSPLDAYPRLKREDIWAALAHEAIRLQPA